MCGIGGFFKRINIPIENEFLYLSKMKETLHHRGKDQNGIVYLKENNFGMIHLRLSILDLSEAGKQPMWNDSKSLVITYNGEVYNFKIIRDEIEKIGGSFFSKTDTEVILKGYEIYGTKILEKLEGMYAFAIVDKINNSLFIARDRIGEKPLYYWVDEQEKFIIYSSEIKALLNWPFVSKKISPDALNNYLALGYVAGSQSIFCDIKKLLPGHYLIFNENGLTIKSYWNIKNLGYKFSKKEDYIRLVRSKVESVIEQRMISDVPIGTFLSGGVDSSIITGVVSRKSNCPIHTFSAAFDVGERSFKYNSDADIAELVSLKYGTNHSRLSINMDKGLTEKFSKVMWHIDEPHFNATILTTFLLSEFAKKAGISVILTGDGSDEIFGGYPRYLNDRYISILQYLPKILQSASVSVFGNTRFAIVKRILDKTSIIPRTPERYLMWWEMFTKDMREALLSNDMKSGLLSPNKTVGKQIAMAPSFLDDQNLLGFLDLMLWLPEESNCRVDRMSMAHTLEVRAPFEDHNLIEMMFNIPFSKKTDFMTNKLLLKKLFKDILLRDVFEGQKKGFLSPNYYWLKDHFYDYAIKHIRSLFDTNLFSNNVLEKIIKMPKYNSLQIWTLFSFALWYSVHVQPIEK